MNIIEDHNQGCGVKVTLHCVVQIEQGVIIVGAKYSYFTLCGVDRTHQKGCGMNSKPIFH